MYPKFLKLSEFVESHCDVTYREKVGKSYFHYMFHFVKVLYLY